jgi:hypothetical protein
LAALFTTTAWDQLSDAMLRAQGPAHVAVAYFGAGGSQLLPLLPESLLVVDGSVTAVSSGQTCPSDLLALHNRGVRIHSFRNLHAKVYAFPDVAFIGSPNVSRHSQQVLLESVLRTRRRSDVEAAKQFVRSLCITALDSGDLIRLEKLYRPPKVGGAVSQNKAIAETLIMQLTLEQGRGRETQVQPPTDVWSTYFGFNSSGQLPTGEFTLRNGRLPMAKPERRPVVSHHHVWTLEIADAGPPRPAILKLKRVTSTSFLYYVYRTSDPEFGQLQNLLRIIRNPAQGSGRRWIVI